MILKDYEFLFLLLLLPLIAYWSFKKISRPTWKFSSIQVIKGAPKSLRLRLVSLPLVFQLVCLVLLIFVMARPQSGDERSEIIRQGIAIMMVLDRSSSMKQKDFIVDNTAQSRFSSAKEAFKKFVVGDEGVGGRDNDMVGMLSFARWADTHSPLTLDHQMIVDLLEDVDMAQNQQEDGTAIGEAIAAACEKLKRTEKFPHPPRSKIMVLITDGKESVSNRDKSAIKPKDATELAQSLGIKIYTIGVAPQAGEPVVTTNPFTGQEILRRRQVEVDEKLLSDISKLTGGQYFRASDNERLKEVMENIDILEKSNIEDTRYTRYSEKYLPILLVMIGIWVCSTLLSETYLKRGP